MTGDNYDKALGYLDAVSTPDLFAQLATAYALLEIADALDESGDSLDIIEAAVKNKVSIVHLP